MQIKDLAKSSNGTNFIQCIVQQVKHVITTYRQGNVDLLRTHCNSYLYSGGTMIYAELQMVSSYINPTIES